MTRDLTRLLRPRCIAIIGGRAEATFVMENCAKVGFQGPVWHVHPKRGQVARLADLPTPPDAAFICVNRVATIDVLSQLHDMGAGGAVAYAAGFAEAATEFADAHELQAQLLQAARDMPVIGPNCYGFLNYLDGAALWPDQQGGIRTEAGVAIVTQSSNVAINLTMQRRGLPVAYMLTAGNQAQLSLSDLARAAIADPRVTALGLHIEGVGDVADFSAMAAAAQEANIPIVALKPGRSEAARASTVSHTASLAGSSAGATALFERLGIAEVTSLTALIEALKLLHVTGGLSSNRIASMSCSGGEAGLMADAVLGHDLCYPPLTDPQRTGLHAALGDRVTLANPLDYNTYIWNQPEAIQATFTAMMQGDLGLGIVVADLPRADRCAAADWEPVIAGTIAATKATGRPMAMLATMSENMPEDLATRLIANGVAPLQGIEDAMVAVAAAAKHGGERGSPAAPWPPGQEAAHAVLTEAQGKAELCAYGLDVPRSTHSTRAGLDRVDAHFPLVLKAEGLAHKTEAGGVALNLRSKAQIIDAASKMPGDAFLIEEMIADPLVELLIGVTRDPAHGFLMTLSAGGTWTELMADSAHLLLPASREDILTTLNRLRIAPVLQGYRGAAPAPIQGIVDAALAVATYVADHRDTLEEIEINPLIVTPTRAVAADVLIRR